MLDVGIRQGGGVAVSSALCRGEQGQHRADSCFQFETTSLAHLDWAPPPEQHPPTTCHKGSSGLTIVDVECVLCVFCCH